MISFDLNSISSALDETSKAESGVDFSGKSLKLDTAENAKPIVDAINSCANLQYLRLTGNTLGVLAAEAISGALASHPELKSCHFSDMFTGRMKTEIPPALSALGEGMIAAGARLRVLDLSDNAFGPIGVEGLGKLLQSDVCSELEELRLNNNGLGISGGRLLAAALSARPRRLRVLVAGRNRLENDGAKALAHVFQGMGSLEQLSMPQNGIYHPGVAALAAALANNPRLEALDLNDNTVGPRGAAALAMAFPRLKNLRSINFGDCLLKSKGALTLAKAFRENKLSLESVNLSHNEIGRAAVRELADALLTHGPLRSVVLAGNSLGGAELKAQLRARLGDAAQLSDGDDDDDEYVTDSEESEGESQESDAASDDGSEASGDAASPPENARIELDSTEVEEAVSSFLKAPTDSGLAALGPSAKDLIYTHLQSIKDQSTLIQSYIEATLLVSGLVSGRAAAAALWAGLTDLHGQQHALEWITADAVLRGLGLIKTEDKSFKLRWDVANCYSALADVITQDFFPGALRDTLRFFIRSKLSAMSPSLRAAVEARPELTS